MGQTQQLSPKMSTGHPCVLCFFRTFFVIIYLICESPFGEAFCVADLLTQYPMFRGCNMIRRKPASPVRCARRMLLKKNNEPNLSDCKHDASTNVLVFKQSSSKIITICYRYPFRENGGLHVREFLFFTGTCQYLFPARLPSHGFTRPYGIGIKS